MLNIFQRSQLTFDSYNLVPSFGYNFLYDIEYCNATGPYYLMANSLYITDVNFNYIDSFFMSTFYRSKCIDNSLYVAHGANIVKFDIKRDLTNQIDNTTTPSQGNFNEFVYDQNSNLIIAIDTSDNTLKYFDRNLNFKNSTQIGNYVLKSLVLYNQKMYIGTFDNKILVVQNGIVITTYNIPCVNPNGMSGISSILIDSYSYMAVGCYDDPNVYLYHTNGTYTGLSLSSAQSQLLNTLRFDRTGKLLLIGDDQSGANQVLIYQ